jgi:hypothetical protein
MISERLPLSFALDQHSQLLRSSAFLVVVQSSLQLHPMLRAPLELRRESSSRLVQPFSAVAVAVRMTLPKVAELIALSHKRR